MPNPQNHHASTPMNLPCLDMQSRRQAAASQQAGEVEKRRFLEVLYDDLGQSLSVLKPSLEWLQHKAISEQKAVRHCVTQMQATLDGIIGRNKRMASRLRPILLDDFGLIAGLQWITSDRQRKPGIGCQLSSPGAIENVSRAMESAVFSLVEESQLNIERHAGVSDVTIWLWRNDLMLDVLMQDDGIGLTAGSKTRRGCYGLIGMQERLYTLNGSIRIINIEAKGLAKHASIPLSFH